MNAEFLRFYEQELSVLYEQAAAFAEEFPGIAERLGGLTREKTDPGITGLIEGCAFMAARVQLKLSSEFLTFTTELLERLLPDYLAPTPSLMLVEARPDFGNKDLVSGKTFAAGSLIDTVFVEAERRVACRFRIAHDLRVVPLAISDAEYLTSPAALQALGLEVQRGTLGGLKLTIRRFTHDPDDQATPARDSGEAVFLSELRIDALPFHITGAFGDGVALYEQLFSQLNAISVRHFDEFGNARFIRLDAGTIEQIGFGQDPLFGHDERMPQGLALLRGFFAFPGAYLGFRLVGLRRILSRLDVEQADIFFEFGEVNASVAPRVAKAMFRLNVVLAVNLFELTCGRIRLKADKHEYQVVPDTSRWIDYEPYGVVKVEAIFPGERDKIPVYPLYGAPPEDMQRGKAHYYSTRRLPRRRTDKERRFGLRTAYLGSELFLTLNEPVDLDSPARARELSVRAVCTNRHLTEQLPVGARGAELRFVDDTSISLDCIAGPTPPRESIVAQERRNVRDRSTGPILWRLVNLLNFNHHALSRQKSGHPAGALREILALFADMNDLATDRRLRGIVDLRTRAVSRRLRQPDGFNIARGIEITVTFDESAFEGAGIMLLGAVLDRFFADYSSINSFTETVVASRQRGTVKRWPPRSGTGPVL